MLKHEQHITHRLLILSRQFDLKNQVQKEKHYLELKNS